MTRLLASSTLLVFALAAGCNNGLDHDSAVKVTNSALNGTVAADVHVMTNGLPTGNVDITLTNTAGTGTAHVTGAVTRTAGMTNTTVDITFANWTDDGITLNGSLHEAGMFSSPVPISGNVKLTGALSASGAVSGNADFDLTGSYSPTGFSVAGNVGGQSINVTVGVSP